jgi:hypothetical protein
LAIKTIFFIDQGIIIEMLGLIIPKMASYPTAPSQTPARGIAAAGSSNLLAYALTSVIQRVSAAYSGTFTVEKMHLRKRQLGASPVAGFFLNRPFGCQKHLFKHKIQDYF